MVDIKIDEIYRKPSNFFLLEFSSTGKLYKIPADYELKSEEWDLSVRDWESSGRLSCVKFMENFEEVDTKPSVLKSLLIKYTAIQLKKNNFLLYKAGSSIDSSYVAYSTTKEIECGDKDIYRVFDGFEYRIVLLNDQFCLCVNPHLKIKTEASVKYLVEKGLPSDQLFLIGAEYFENYNRKRCNIISSTNTKCKIRDVDTDEDKEVDADSVFIISKPDVLQNLLVTMKRKSNIVDIQRKYSFLSDREASKARFHKTTEIASEIAEKIFPIKFGDFKVEFIPKTISLRT